MQYVSVSAHDVAYIPTLPVATPGFLPDGAANFKRGYLANFFPQNCMKLKEFGPPGARVPGAPLDPPKSQNVKF